MRILMIGGTRFIGPPVVRLLAELGHHVALFHRRPPEVELPPGVQHILGDRRDHLADFAETFRRFEPDVVVDMIPITERDAQMVVGTFKGMTYRVVAISSQDVYRAYGRVNGTEPGPPDPTPLTEDSPLRERLYPYRGDTPRAPNDPTRLFDDYEKILVERVIMSDPGLPGTVLRLPMIYGPHDYQHRVHQYLRRMDDGRPAIVVSDQMARWRWTRDYVENTAAAIALAITDDRAAGQIYNIGEMPALTLAEWIERIGLIAGWDGEVVVAPDYQLPEDMRAQAGFDQDLVADSSRIRDELGYQQPVPLDEALRETIAWERANPPAHADPPQPDYNTEDTILARL